MRAPHQPVWWSPFAQWERFKASREAARQVRSAFQKLEDERALAIRRVRRDLVRVVRVKQGYETEFEVQWRLNREAPWKLAWKSYSQSTAEWRADGLAREIWRLGEPKDVQVVG